MMRIFYCFLLAILSPTTFAAEFNQSSMSVVVSVRHFKASAGKSFFHLRLYKGDGTFQRQLTKPDGANDMNPVFSPDGKQVCFVRIEDAGTTKTSTTYCLLQNPDKPSLLDLGVNPPAWYSAANEILEKQSVPHHALDSETSSTEHYPSPDRAYDIVIHYNYPNETSDPVGGFGCNATFWLFDKQTSSTLRMSAFKGFENLSSVWLIPDTPYLYEGSLKLAFFRCHQGSTFGASMHALDLPQKNFYTLTKNGGAVLPIPGVPGFFFSCDERYCSLGYRDKTVNCDYLDFWNASMKRTRFAPDLSQFGGAAIFIPNKGAFVFPTNIERTGDIWM